MEAKRLGAAAARALAVTQRGELRAVYEHAAALVLDDGTHLGLLPADAPLHPWALNIGFAWRSEDVGLSAEVVEGRVRIGHIRVELGGAEVLALRLSARPARLPPQLLPRLAAVERPVSPFDGPLAEILNGAAAGSTAGELWRLVGVGEGLTPSGDDILVGMLAAWDFLGDCDAAVRQRREAVVKAAPADLAARTTRLAAQFISSAMEGSYAEPLLGLLEAAMFDEARWSAALAQILACGHRSGADVVAGVGAAVGAVAGATRPR